MARISGKNVTEPKMCVDFVNNFVWKFFPSTENSVKHYHEFT